MNEPITPTGPTPQAPSLVEPKAREVPSHFDSIGDRMYVQADKPTRPPAANPEAAATASAGETSAPAPVWTSVDELVNREISAGDAMYAQAANVPQGPDEYQAVLRAGFDHLEQQARNDRNEADIQALSEGRREAAALMHELQVPRQEARELTQTLGDWVSKPALTEDANWDNKISSLRSLEQEWGRDTQARIQLAQRTAAEACKRMPWLADLLAAGAGNDPKVIKRFAEIGLRQARNASKVGKNRNG